MRDNHCRNGLRTVLGVFVATALLSVVRFSVAQEEEAEAIDVAAGRTEAEEAEKAREAARDGSG